MNYEYDEISLILQKIICYLVLSSSTGIIWEEARDLGSADARCVWRKEGVSDGDGFSGEELTDEEGEANGFKVDIKWSLKVSVPPGQPDFETG